MVKALTPFMLLILVLSVALSVAQAMPDESGTVWFNGRATHVGQLFSYETSVGDIGTLVQGQAPKVWDGLLFVNNDIQVVSDSRYGHVYSIRAGVGSRDPWWDPGPGVAQSELTRLRTNDLGKWDWFSAGFRIDSGLTGPGWIMLSQLGYPSLGSPPLALDLVKRSGRLYYGLFRNAGLLTQRAGTSFYQGSSFEDKALVPVPYGTWVDFIIGVKWATGNTGELRVYARVQGKRGFKLLVNKSRIPTWQYGTTPAGTINAAGLGRTGAPVRVLDKAGLYFGYWDSRATFPTESLLETGLTRSSTYRAAVSTLP
jgi:polysaccharide lyase-like protein